MNDVIVKTTDFEIAVAWVTKNFMTIPKDDLLRLYAFYKVANGMRHEPNNRQPIVSAFKVNAIMQATHLSSDTAKREYVGLVSKLKQKD
ncbi:MAG: acyl-CoA-binding protein [Flavobacteriaceae bacterium]|jgi:diazepam-binding inhibitor (GABA receptor modulating acyl-CoA-binding protein)|tara:strand:+ start:1311 stop:1577 length:267 start_codon:yes stop_codon:yes gene_type:complete